jgi:hypothetical protein
MPPRPSMPASPAPAAPAAPRPSPFSSSAPMGGFRVPGSNDGGHGGQGGHGSGS